MFLVLWARENLQEIVKLLMGEVLQTSKVT